MKSSRLIPVMMIVIILAFSIRLTEVITGFSSLSSTAFAEDAQKEEVPPESEPAETANAQAPTEEKEPDAKAVAAGEAEAPKWRDANDESLDLSDVKLEMFEDLSRRREEIEKAEQELRVREALIQAAEQEMQRKVDELSKLRKEIEGLLGEQSDQEQERIQKLVKIYEGMKPDKAAGVFNTLDVDILVSVLTKMSERKVSPILSAMNPERARTVTIMMAEQNKLPVLQ